jgi:hypothetical protein
MRMMRPMIASDPGQFGRRVVAPAAATESGAGASEDLRLFLTTFAAGFAFTLLLIA